MVGLDYSQAFIAKCQELKTVGQAGYFLTTEGLLGDEKTACIDASIVSGLHVHTTLLPTFTLLLFSRGAVE